MTRINKAAEIRKFLEIHPDGDRAQLMAYAQEKFGDPEFLPITKLYKFRKKLRSPQSQGRSRSGERRRQIEDILQKIGINAELEDFRAYCVKHDLQIPENRFYEFRKKLQRQNTPITLTNEIVDTIRAAKALIVKAGGVDQAKGLLEELRQNT